MWNAGILSTNVKLRKIHIKKMTKTIHRGPDNTNIWENDILSLGHTRLSIIDLSPMEINLCHHLLIDM